MLSENLARTPIIKTLKATNSTQELSIICDCIAQIQTFTLQCYVKAGSRHEHPDINGTAHFLEHMAFKGSKHYSAKEQVETIENVGGSINAWTSQELTCYEVQVLCKDAHLAFQVLSDLVLLPRLEIEDIEQERKVIKQEITGSADQPDDRVSDLYCRAAYGDNMLAYPILGTLESITNINQQTLQEFHQRYYQCSNMVLSMTGGLSVAEMSDLSTLFLHHSCVVQDTSKNLTKTTSSYTKAPFIPRCKSQAIDTEQIHLMLGFHDKYYDGQDITQAMIALLGVEILGGGMASRLFQEIREERALAYSICASLQSYLDVSSVTIYAGTALSNANKIIHAIKQTLDKLKLDGIQLQELNRAKQVYKAGFLFNLESYENRTGIWARQMLVHQQMHDHGFILDHLENITTQMINQWFCKLDTLPPALAVIGPKVALEQCLDCAAQIGWAHRAPCV